MHQEHKNTITQNKLKLLKSPGLVASYEFWPIETERAYSQRKDEQGTSYIAYGK